MSHRPQESQRRHRGQCCPECASALRYIVRAVAQLVGNPADCGKEVAEKLNEVLVQGEKIVAVLDDLTAEVARNTTVTGSVVALLDGLVAKLDAAIASGDPAKVQAEVDAIRANTDALAAASERNTRS